MVSRKNYRLAVVLCFLVAMSFAPGAAEEEGLETISREVDISDEAILNIDVSIDDAEIYIEQCKKNKLFQSNISFDKGKTIPVIQYTKENGYGFLSLQGKDITGSVRTALNEGKIEVIMKDSPDCGKWKLELTDKIPITIDMSVGVQNGNLDFSNLKLRELTLNIGAADTKIYFGERNSEKLTTMNIVAGAGGLEIKGLANANFSSMRLKAGAGKAVLDFSGKLSHDAKAEISMGAGSVRLLIPESMGAMVICQSSFLSSVLCDGGFKREGKVYTNAEYGKNSANLIIEIDVPVGSIIIESIE
jgi:hypothetical protein